MVSGYIPGHQDITLRGWMFCVHGREHCHNCCADHRFANNVMLEEELPAAEFRQLTARVRVLDDRRPLDVGGRYKVLPGGTTVCVAHSTVGCGACFDFGREAARTAC